MCILLLFISILEAPIAKMIAPNSYSWWWWWWWWW